jgi:hypothetical protein
MRRPLIGAAPTGPGEDNSSGKGRA